MKERKSDMERACKEMRLGVAVDVEKCNGCRTCELVCSLHLSGMFDPYSSAIRIVRPDVHGPISSEIRDGCDLCSGLSIPYCVEFCPTDAVFLTRVP